MREMYIISHVLNAREATSFSIRYQKSISLGVVSGNYTT